MVTKEDVGKAWLIYNETAYKAAVFICNSKEKNNQHHAAFEEAHAKWEKYQKLKEEYQNGKGK